MNGMPPYGAPVPSPMNGMPPYGMQPLPRAYFVQAQMPRKRVGSFSIVGFTLSCFSMLLFYFGLLGLLFAGTGLVLSAVGIGKRRTMSLWGLGLAGVIVGSFFLFFSFVMFCAYIPYGPFGILSMPYMYG